MVGLGLDRLQRRGRGLAGVTNQVIGLVADRLERGRGRLTGVVGGPDGHLAPHRHGLFGLGSISAEPDGMCASVRVRLTTRMPRSTRSSKWFWLRAKTSRV